MIKSEDKQVMADQATQESIRGYLFDPPATIQIFFPDGPACINVTKINIGEWIKAGGYSSINCILNGAIVGEFRRVTGWMVMPDISCVQDEGKGEGIK